MPGVEPDMFAWVDGDRRDEGMDAIERIQGKLASSNLADAIRTTRDAFRTGDRTALAALDIPAATWIDGLDADPEAVDYVRSFMAAMGGAQLERCSVLPLLWDMVELDYSPAEVFVDIGELFDDGTKSLIDPMADGARHPVRDGRDACGSRRRRRDGDARGRDDGAEAAVIALP